MNKELYEFLIEAKKQTYANASVEKVNSSRKGSHDYHYKNDKMIYHDTYFGGTKFMGEEVVYRGGDTPKWGMNYYGVTLDSSLSEEAMDQILRPALMKAEDNKSLPVRGPKEFKNKDYTYTFEGKGNLESFEGIETIYKHEKKIYELKCHGGMECSAIKRRINNLDIISIGSNLKDIHTVEETTFISSWLKT